MLIVMIVYMSVITLWGFYQGKKVKTNSEYSIAGRRLPGWVAALSERATGESSWALLGLPGAAYATGLLETWTAIGCVLGVICAWLFLAGRLRNEAEKYEIETFMDFIAKRHGNTGKYIRITGSLAIVFFFFFYVGAQFIGGGKTIENLFGINQLWGMLFIVILVVPYTIYGGFRSVTYTDVIQAIIMVVTLIIAPIAGIIYLSEAPEGTTFAHSIADALTKAGHEYSSFTGGAQVSHDSPLYQFLYNIFPESPDLLKGLGTGIIIAGAFSWFFGYQGGQPQLTTRFMAIKSPKEAKRASIIGIIWTIIAYSGALMVGWIGLAIFGPTGLEDQEKVMPQVLTTLFHPIIAGILITGVLAAIISTANSLLILSSTELSESVITPLNKKYGRKNSPLFQSRIVTAVLSIIALTMAYFSPEKLIYTIVSFVWAGIGSTFSVVIVLTLFWKRFHGIPALLTIITGIVFTLIWMMFGMEQFITARLMTFIIALLIAVLSTWMIKKRQ